MKILWVIIVSTWIFAGIVWVCLPIILYMLLVIYFCLYFYRNGVWELVRTMGIINFRGKKRVVPRYFISVSHEYFQYVSFVIFSNTMNKKKMSKSAWVWTDQNSLKIDDKPSDNNNEEENTYCMLLVIVDGFHVFDVNEEVVVGKSAVWVVLRRQINGIMVHFLTLAFKIKATFIICLYSLAGRC